MSEPSTADVGLLSPQWAGSEVSRITSDAAVLAAMVEVEVALVEAWAQLGLAGADDVSAVRSVAQSLRLDASDLAVRARSGGNPVIPLVGDLRAAVAERDVDASKWVHRGATSQDVLDTALMLVARRALRTITGDLAATARALAELAEEHRETLMVSRTLGQHGVPSTFGVKAAGWLSGVTRAGRLLRDCGEALPVQWGGAGGTLASFAVIAEPGAGGQIASLLAATLGLRPASPWQTQRGPVVELGAALAQTSGALGKLAVDVLSGARPEVGELGEPLAAGRGGSSAMPQKQNPVLSVLIHSSAQRSPGLSAELQRSALAVDERPDGAWHSEWSVLRELLRLVGGAAEQAAELTRGLRVDAAAMRRNLALSGPLVVSERLMLELGPRLGRDRLQSLIASVMDGDGELFEMLRAAPQLSALGDEELRAMLDPAGYLGDAQMIIDDIVAEFRDGGPLGMVQP